MTQAPLESIDKCMSEKMDSKGQNYAINKPKIFLEVLSARSTTVVFAITYIVFIIGFGIDIKSTYTGFTSSNIISPAVGPQPNSYSETIRSLQNVISVQASVQQMNVTKMIANNAGKDLTITYDATIWACYIADGCGQNFVGGSLDQHNFWHEVILVKSTAVLPVASIENDILKVNLIPTTFQNEESIPQRGKVRSYFLSVNYTKNPYNLFLTSSNLRDSNVLYTVSVFTTPATTITSGSFSIILLFIVCATLIGFVCVMIKQKKKWLSEQIWCVFYLIALICFINPIFCVIVWLDEISPITVFVFYIFDAMGNSSFIVVWLMFADNISKKSVSKLVFYGPKILIGFATFVLTIASSIYQFPTLSPSGSLNKLRPPVQAVSGWLPQLLISYTAVSIAVLVLILIWTIYWLATLMVTGRKLRRLPYMNTRYKQLSYRFFALQAWLLAAYFVFQYAFVMYFLLVKARNGGDLGSIVQLTDYLNTVSRQQVQLFGKVVFLTVYGLVLTFLFLPTSIVEGDLVTRLARTYVLTEKEMNSVEKSRRLLIKNVPRVRHIVHLFVQYIDTNNSCFTIHI
jgi:hypothetical protein